MRAGRKFPRWLPLCAAALVLLQLEGMLHLAAAPHGLCWEHGMAVDLDTAPGGGESVAAPEGVGRATVPLVRSDAHPHCPALWILRPARLDAARPAPVLGSTSRAPSVTVRQEISAPSGWALRCAPKQSPPV